MKKIVDVVVNFLACILHSVIDFHMSEKKKMEKIVGVDVSIERNFETEFKTVDYEGNLLL